MQLTCRHALGIGTHHVDGDQPFPQRKVRPFEQRAHANRKLFAADTAFEQPEAGGFAFDPIDPFIAAAMGTDRSVWPEMAFDNIDGPKLDGAQIVGGMLAACWFDGLHVKRHDPQ